MQVRKRQMLLKLTSLLGFAGAATLVTLPALTQINSNAKLGGNSNQILAQTAPGLGQPTDPTAPGLGQPTDPTAPGLGQPTDPTAPGLGQPTDPAAPGTTTTPDATTPGLGQPTDPTAPGTTIPDTTTPEDTTTPGVGAPTDTDVDNDDTTGVEQPAGQGVRALW
ncbi:hypothetical protein [Gloeocapsopsis dulcis]|uniref:hypothetical protein n=1 Tax=Gloeocapsopsis dulcis TaxID=2859516 RepID=UPI000CF7159C|nr:hypothetical protein [Gloeocapsopsis dulcis]WNN88666.1 hypothetical protein P0S91_20685 [Gloeocapsopsis dulcis]